MNHFIFFQVSVSHESGYDEPISLTHVFLILDSTSYNVYIEVVT